jgi:hypothetical protein
MATILPLPQKTKNSWEEIESWLKNQSGYIFDPSQNAQSSSFPIMDDFRPKSLTDQIAESILYGVGIPPAKKGKK